MRNTIQLIVVMLFSMLWVNAQDKPAYELFNNQGKKTKYSKMVQDLSEADMVFFGEYHTNPISHWLQIEVSKSLFEIKGDKLFLGAEMFESGNQLVLDEYLSGFYPEKKMLNEITQLWKNYSTDYKPLVEFARENKLRFIATNIPRRYASMIHKEGLNALDKLSPEANKLIGPIEEFYNSEVYADMSEMMGGHMMNDMDNMKLAQASKDATMAHFSILNHSQGDILLHFQGAYHSDNSRGIIWWVNAIEPGYKIKSITTVYQSKWGQMTKEEIKSIADYIIVVPDNMTQTYR